MERGMAFVHDGTSWTRRSPVERSRASQPSSPWWRSSASWRPPPRETARTRRRGAGPPRRAVVGAGAAAVAALVAGLLIRAGSRSDDAWPSAAGIGWAMFLVAAVCATFLVIGSTSTMSIHPRAADIVLLGLLVPFTIAMRDE